MLLPGRFLLSAFQEQRGFCHYADSISFGLGGGGGDPFTKLRHVVLAVMRGGEERDDF